MTSADQSNTARLHMWVTGQVQGVGFRAFVAQNAQSIGLTGWVRNVGWDTVETVAEGTRKHLESFSETVKNGPRASKVEIARVEWEQPTGEFTRFEVRRNS